MSNETSPAELLDPDAVVGAILDPELRGELYPWYHRLREIAPVHPTQAFGVRRGWLLTRYDDARAVLGNLRLVSDRRSLEIFDTGESGAEFYAMMSKQLLYLDPPDHDRIRALVTRGFTPRAIQDHRPRIQREVDRLLDTAEQAGKIDLVRDFAYPLPIAVICNLMGIPQRDVERFLTWAHDFARRGDVSHVTDEVIQRGEEASRGFHEYFLDLSRSRRRQPGDDLVSALVLAEEAGQRLSDEEIVSTCVLLLQAGHETTADLISLGLRGLLLQPEQLSLLRAEPRRIAAAAEELLRWDTSVQISQRVATERIEIGGVAIPAGDVCILLNGAANRDPARYPQADRIDITRGERDHLAFGLGRYVCLGQSLARLEIQIALATLVQRFPGLDFADEPVFRPSLYLRGLASLPLRW